MGERHSSKIPYLDRSLLKSALYNKEYYQNKKINKLTQLQSLIMFLELIYENHGVFFSFNSSLTHLRDFYSQKWPKTGLIYNSRNNEYSMNMHEGLSC